MHSVAEMAKKQMRDSSDAASRDRGEVAAVCLLFQPQDAGKVTQKCGRFQTGLK